MVEPTDNLLAVGVERIAIAVSLLIFSRIGRDARSQSRQ